MMAMTRAETKIGVGDLSSPFGICPPALFCPPIHLPSFTVPRSPDAPPRTLFYVQTTKKASRTSRRTSRRKPTLARIASLYQKPSEKREPGSLSEPRLDPAPATSLPALLLGNSILAVARDCVEAPVEFDVVIIARAAVDDVLETVRRVYPVVAGPDGVHPRVDIRELAGEGVVATETAHEQVAALPSEDEDLAAGTAVYGVVAALAIQRVYPAKSVDLAAHLRAGDLVVATVDRVRQRNPGGQRQQYYHRHHGLYGPSHLPDPSPSGRSSRYTVPAALLKYQISARSLRVEKVQQERVRGTIC